MIRDRNEKKRNEKFFVHHRFFKRKNRLRLNWMYMSQLWMNCTLYLNVYIRHLFNIVEWWIDSSSSSSYWFNSSMSMYVCLSCKLVKRLLLCRHHYLIRKWTARDSSGKKQKWIDWNVFDEIRIIHTIEQGNLSLSHMSTKKDEKDLIWKRLSVHLILFFSFLEMLRNAQIYQENDQSFDAIVIDPSRDQIIIGAK